MGCRSPHLHGVEPAVAVEREADDMRGVLVPAGVDRVAHDVPSLREDLFDESLLSAERDALPQVRRDADHQAVAGPAAATLLLLLLPALQLTHHGLQLVVPRLFIQQAEVLRTCAQGVGRVHTGLGGGGQSFPNPGVFLLQFCRNCDP